MNYTYRQIWLINYPVMLSILMEQLINITDAVFLGHVGEVELGASALGSIYYLAIYMLGFGFSLGVQVMVGQYNGKGHYTGTGRTFFQGLVFLCVLAILLSPVSYTHLDVYKRQVYHRINKNHLNDGPGWHREVCIDRMEFNPDGTIKQVIPTP